MSFLKVGVADPIGAAHILAAINLGAVIGADDEAVGRIPERKILEQHQPSGPHVAILEAAGEGARDEKLLEIGVGDRAGGVVGERGIGQVAVGDDEVGCTEGVVVGSELGVVVGEVVGDVDG